MLTFFLLLADLRLTLAFMDLWGRKEVDVPWKYLLHAAVVGCGLAGCQLAIFRINQ